jgi:hypothetical protein
MVLAAGDEDIVAFAGLQANIMIGIERVPIERVGNALFGDFGADDIGAIGRLLGMNGKFGLDRGIGGDDGHACCTICPRPW